VTTSPATVGAWRNSIPLEFKSPLRIYPSSLFSTPPRFERIFWKVKRARDEASLQYVDAVEEYLDVARFPGGTVLWFHTSEGNSIAHKKIVRMEYLDRNASGSLRPYPSSEPQKFGPGLTVKMPIELAPGASKRFRPLACVSRIYGCIGLISVSTVYTVCCCEDMFRIAESWLRSLPGADPAADRKPKASRP